MDRVDKSWNFGEFLYLSAQFCPISGQPWENLNNSIYIYQNLVGLKRTKNRQTILQHTKISDLIELRWIYGTSFKVGQI